MIRSPTTRGQPVHQLRRSIARPGPGPHAVQTDLIHGNDHDFVHRFNRVGTIDLRTDYLHQGMGQRFTATGRIIRMGGRIASIQMSLLNDEGLLIATGCASYVIS